MTSFVPLTGEVTIVDTWSAAENPASAVTVIDAASAGAGMRTEYTPEASGVTVAVVVYPLGWAVMRTPNGVRDGRPPPVTAPVTSTSGAPRMASNGTSWYPGTRGSTVRFGYAAGSTPISIFSTALVLSEGRSIRVEYVPARLPPIDRVIVSGAPLDRWTSNCSRVDDVYGCPFSSRTPAT